MSAKNGKALSHRIGRYAHKDENKKGKQSEGLARSKTK